MWRRRTWRHFWFLSEYTPDDDANTLEHTEKDAAGDSGAKGCFRTTCNK
jgi:hypothetical protein